MEMPDPPRNSVPSLGDPLLDAVLDAAASLIVVGDNEGRLLCWNHACEQLSGYTAEEIGRSPAILDKLVVEEGFAQRGRLVQGVCHLHRLKRVRQT